MNRSLAIICPIEGLARFVTWNDSDQFIHIWICSAQHTESVILDVPPQHENATSRLQLLCSNGFWDFCFVLCLDFQMCSGVEVTNSGLTEKKKYFNLEFLRYIFVCVLCKQDMIRCLFCLQVGCA